MPPSHASMPARAAPGVAVAGAGPRGRVAIVQPLPGLGDMIWHLPHIAAIARHTLGGRVTLVAKPSSQAEELLASEQAVADILWLNRNPREGHGRHDGLSGLSGLARLVGALRARRFDSAVLLHHSRTLAFALCSAGIANRFGYGHVLQRPFLNRRPYLTAAVLRHTPYQQASAWLAAAGWSPAASEPVIAVGAPARQAVERRLAGRPGRLVALGLGSSEAAKQWGTPHFTALCNLLLAAGWPVVVAIGGPAEAAMIDQLARACPAVVPAAGWRLGEVGALLERAAFYVGNDTGVMNLAAAVGCRSYGLFGSTTPLAHSRHIVPVVPPDACTDRPGGMARISPAAVIAAIVSDRGRSGP